MATLKHNPVVEAIGAVMGDSGRDVLQEAHWVIDKPFQFSCPSMFKPVKLLSKVCLPAAGRGSQSPRSLQPSSLVTPVCR